MKKRAWGFVVPRCVEGVAGGGETLAAELAGRLKLRGDEAVIFTTCARDNRSWENYFPPGDTVEYGVPVKRFWVDARDLEVWVPKQIAISEGLVPSLEDQLDWMAHGVNSSALYAHIQTAADSLDALFFAPYLFPTTFWGALIRPEKSYLIPCLHDENVAYTDVMQSLFRQVSGALFNCTAERELARRLYGDIRGGEVGMGFEPVGEEEIRSLKPFFSDEFPYLLYLGRKETGKNVQVLIDYFTEMKDRGACPGLKLAVAGGGSFDDLHRKAALSRGDILDVTHISEEEKRRLIRYSTALCQPSLNESFSIVIMEAWRLGVPVLVHADCPVTRQHVTDSGGGLYFGGAEDFAAVTEELAGNADLRTALARAGREYVLSKYSWKAALSRFDSVMQELMPE